MHADRGDWGTFRKAMVAVARKRVADDDAEDVVQATLAEALTSKEKPQDPDALRRWLWGVLRHKIADHYRRRRREVLDDSADPGTESPDEATEDLLRWAVQRLPQGGDVQETFQWLLREGEGEKLENIAEETGIPAPRVRKRVSRLRQHLRAHWTKEVAVLAALGIIASVAYFFLKKPAQLEGVQIALPDPAVQEQERKRQRGIELRRDGLRDCELGLDDACILQLDEARKLDPAGENEQTKKARDDAAKHREQLKLENNVKEPVPQNVDPAPTYTNDSLLNPPAPTPTPVSTANTRPPPQSTATLVKPVTPAPMPKKSAPTGGGKSAKPSSMPDFESSSGFVPKK